MPARVAVVGGGVAGLACACDLADAGLDVTLFEAKKVLGGRAFSFRDPLTGFVVDNGQHVILGCCKETMALLTKIGTLDRVRFFDEIDFVLGNGERMTLRGSPLPAPFHLLPSLVGCPSLSRGEKTALLAGLARVLLVRPAKGENARGYLTRTMKTGWKLIEPVLISALNEDMLDASAKYARMVIVKVLLGVSGAHKLGVPQKPLSSLIGEPGRRYLEERECGVVTSTPVRGFDARNDRMLAVRAGSGERRTFDCFVFAVRPWNLHAMGLECGGADPHSDVSGHPCPETSAPCFGTRVSRSIVWRSLVAAHFFYGAEPPPFDQVCVAGEPFGWLFHKREWAGVGVVYVQAVASAADAIAGAPDGALLELARRSIARAVPELAYREPVRTILCRSRRATFSTVGECDALRPGTETRFANVFLAGDWTATCWPSTLESAVRSGRTAARRVMSSLEVTHGMRLAPVCPE